MRSRCTVSAVGLLSLCLVVSASLETITPSAFDGYPDEPCTINITIRNSRLILSWELENKSGPPANYTLWYTVMSKDENLTKVKNCSDTTKSSCDVTDKWLEGMESYVVAIVIVHRGDLTVCRCSDYIVPANAPLEPPEFEIVGFTDHINVTMEFPPVTSKIIQEKMKTTPFVIKEQIGDSVRKKHEPKVNNVTGNFTFVLRDLLPKTNYCVSLYFDDDPAIKSPLKCIVLQPGQESERGLVRREEMTTGDVRKPSSYRDIETANTVTPTFLYLRNPVRPGQRNLGCGGACLCSTPQKE